VKVAFDSKFDFFLRRHTSFSIIIGRNLRQKEEANETCSHKPRISAQQQVTGYKVAHMRDFDGTEVARYRPIGLHESRLRGNHHADIS